MVRKQTPREPGPYARAHLGAGRAEPAKPKRIRKPKPDAAAPEGADAGDQ